MCLQQHSLRNLDEELLEIAIMEKCMEALKLKLCTDYPTMDGVAEVASPPFGLCPLPPATHTWCPLRRYTSFQRSLPAYDMVLSLPLTPWRPWQAWKTMLNATQLGKYTNWIELNRDTFRHLDLLRPQG